MDGNRELDKFQLFAVIVLLSEYKLAEALRNNYCQYSHFIFRTLAIYFCSIVEWNWKLLRPDYRIRWILTISSLPSGQSGSPSQCQRLLIQAPVPQVNSWLLHGITGQSFSSLLSPQSSSWSHFQRFWIQRPLPQVNSSERHVSSKWAEWYFSIRDILDTLFQIWLYMHTPHFFYFISRIYIMIEARDEWQVYKCNMNSNIIGEFNSIKPI